MSENGKFSTFFAGPIPPELFINMIFLTGSKAIGIVILHRLGRFYYTFFISSRESVTFSSPKYSDVISE